MSHHSADDSLDALAEFVARLDEFDPDAPVHAELVVVRGGVETRLTVREPVAHAMAEALRGYHDPRDHGQCDSCGSRRIDDDFLCRDCGHANGLFGQMIIERFGRHVDSAPLTRTADESPNVTPTSHS